MSFSFDIGSFKQFLAELRKSSKSSLERNLNNKILNRHFISVHVGSIGHFLFFNFSSSAHVCTSQFVAFHYLKDILICDLKVYEVLPYLQKVLTSIRSEEHIVKKLFWSTISTTNITLISYRKFFRI